jgi:long-chain fatty acid transport protein
VANTEVIVRNFPSLFLPVVLAFSQSGFAGGFATDVPSVAAMGNSFAGQTTGVHNIADMFINPAVLTQFSGNQIDMNSHYLAPEITVRSAATARTHPLLGDRNIDQTGNSSAGQHAEVNAFIPMLYGMLDLRPDLRLGLSMIVPWGLSTSYPSTWLGRYHALDSEIRSLNFSMVLAHQLTHQLSIAAGPQMQYLHANLSSAIDFGSVLLGAPNLALDGKSEVTGDDWGYGYKIGLLYEMNDQIKLGLSYRTKIHHALKGDNDFTVPAAASIVTSTGQFVDTSAQADLTTPETVNLGASYQVAPDLDVSIDAAWTRWRRIENLVVTHDNPQQASSTTHFFWNNSWYVGLGANYRLNNDWLLRTGVAYEQSSVQEKYLGPRLPLNDKYSASLGFSCTMTQALTMELSYLHQFFKDAHSHLDFDDPNNFFRGSLNADYHVALDVLSLSINYQL